MAYGTTLALITLLGTAVVGGCVARYGSFGTGDVALPAEVSFEQQRDRVYTPDNWPQALDADIYLPETAGDRPAVLLVHGGSWSGGKPGHMNSVARGLARRGFVVMNVAYRLAPDYLYPAPVEDLEQALCWLRSQAGELRIDRQRIGAFGYSAGAHLVTLLATRNAGTELALAAVVAGGTPADLRLWPDSPIVTKFLGKTSYEAPELWQQASPVAHVSGASPPMFLYHGANDTLVEPQQSELLAAALKEAGVQAELRLSPRFGHVTTFIFDRKSVAHGIAFLARELAPREGAGARAAPAQQ